MSAGFNRNLGRGQAMALLGMSGLGFMLPERALAQTASLQTIRIAGALAEDLTPLYYGLKTGMFARAGLNVELSVANSGSAATAAVVSGTYEMAKTSLLGVFNAHLRQIPIVIVAPEVVYSQRDREALLEQAVDTQFKSGSDLVGKTMAVPSLSDLNTLASMAWIDQTGGDSKAVKFLEMPNASMPAALQSHRVDAAIIEPPVLDTALSAKMVKTIADPMSSIAPSYVIAAFITRADWAAQNADALRRFTRTLYAAATYVNAHHAETASYVADLTKIELGIAQKMNRTAGGTALRVDLVQPIIDAAVKYGMLQRAFPARELLWDENAAK